MPVTPVFILSLPRSGSTMLQRELARHPEIATVSEPWFLLGLLPPGDADLSGSTYGRRVYRQAVEDVIAALPGGRDDWNAVMRSAASDLYERLAEAQGGGARYFIDKTPRYALAPEAIHAMFPDAPLIVLWRNPLAIAASMISTYSYGRWNLYRFVQDFEIALPRLVAFVEGNPGSVLALRYEDLRPGSEPDLSRILEHLGLDEADGALIGNAANVALAGRLGDPTGGLNHTVPSLGDDRWKAQFQNPLRRAWARRFLRRIGAERLSVMGYDLNELEAELASCRGFARNLIMDLLLMPRGIFRRLFLTTMLRAQFLRLRHRQPLVDVE